MGKKKETVEQLRERILHAMQTDIGISERMATPFVDSIMSCFAGEHLYFPTPVREYPMDRIRSSLEQGIPVKQVMREHDLSRSKLHDLFPGGLPRPLRRDLSAKFKK